MYLSGKLWINEQQKNMDYFRAANNLKALRKTYNDKQNFYVIKYERC